MAEITRFTQHRTFLPKLLKLCGPVFAGSIALIAVYLTVTVLPSTLQELCCLLKLSVGAEQRGDLSSRLLTLTLVGVLSSCCQR